MKPPACVTPIGTSHFRDEGGRSSPAHAPVELCRRLRILDCCDLAGACIGINYDCKNIRSRRNSVYKWFCASPNDDITVQLITQSVLELGILIGLT